MDHVANETKVSTEMVANMWAEWDKDATEKEASRIKRGTEYYEQHETPRIERMTAYDAYKQQQNDFRSIYFSHAPNRMNALQEWMHVKPSSLLEKGVMHDELYTAFADMPSPLIVSKSHFKNKGHKNV